MTNPSIVFVDKGNAKLVDKPVPELIPGHLLVEAISTQISIGTEMSILMKENVVPGSWWDIYGAYPFDAGYTAVGRVVDTALDIDPGWKGKLVAYYGTHSKYALSPPKETYPVPDGLDLDQALYFVLSEIAMNGVRRSKISWGDFVVVYGCGDIGQLTAHYCAMAGASWVLVADVSDVRLSRLPESDTIIPVNTRREQIANVIREKNNGRMADIVFEVTGSADIIPEEARLLKDTGKLIILSSPRGKTSYDFHDLCNKNSIKIIGAHNASHPAHEEEENPWTKARHAQFFFSLLQRGKLDVRSMVTHRVPYTQALSMYEMLKTDRSAAGGIHISWQL